MYGRLGQEILAIQEQEMEPTESQENLQEETETKAETTKDSSSIFVIVDRDNQYYPPPPLTYFCSIFFNDDLL